MLKTWRGLSCLAFFVPAAALSGFAVVMARKIVKRGPKDYRRAELTGDGKRIRIDLMTTPKLRGALECSILRPRATQESVRSR